MRWLHYIEVENFKRLGGIQRIPLDHPAVLIGPNNCGKTSVIQAIALWSQAVRTWVEEKGETQARERPSAALNRLAITAVPVPRTRCFWHNVQVHSGQAAVPMSLAAGLEWKGRIVPVRMRFRYQGDEVVYCVPDAEALENRELLREAAGIPVELLYPMSGIAGEEPVLKEGRINVLLGQGETAQVLRNLCLMVQKDSPDGWQNIVLLLRRLFDLELGTPVETLRGGIELTYRQSGIREPLDIALAGRGFQQLLLVFAYLHSHPGSVLLIDEPDAHLEILRQRQVYVLLRELAAQNRSQVILVTHSEVILDEALERHLTLLVDGRAELVGEDGGDGGRKSDVRNALRHYGTAHYLRARQRRHVLYVEGGTDVDMLRALAVRLEHPVATVWDERLNAYYVQDNFPLPNAERELARVEGGFGVTPKDHFFGLRDLVPGLRGLAILDNDGRDRSDSESGGLRITYWKRYEIENYVVHPALLAAYARTVYADLELFDGHRVAIQEVMDALVLEQVFGGIEADHEAYRSAPPGAARLVWESKTERLKLSSFAEAFFRRLADRLGQSVLLRKGEFHRLVPSMAVADVPKEIRQKLDLLEELFRATSGEFGSGPVA